MLAAALAAAALAFIARPAEGNHLSDFVPTEPSCRYLEAGAPGPADNKLEVELGNTDSVELERVDSRIRVNRVDYELHREIKCDYGRATVDNTDTIVLIPASSGSDAFYFDNSLSIDMQDGLFAPGATPEADGSEIEMHMQGGRAAIGDISIITTDSADQIRAVTTLTETELNLNAGETTQDVDIELPPILFGALYTGDGDDVVVNTNKIKLKGKRGRVYFPFGLSVLGEGGNDLIKAAEAAGGAGDDNLVGDNRLNILIGGPGHDAIRGKNSTDLLISDGGRDLVLGGSGGDFLMTADGNGDKARCGDGRDLARVDAKDKRSGCERLKRVRGVKPDSDPDDDFLPFKIRMRTRSGKPVLRG